MENALLVGLSRQMALARELDVIANNVANGSTNGFKARSTRFSEFLGTNARAETFPTPDRRVSYVVERGTPIDLSGGAIERTGNPLDAAIKGNAFFVVQTPQGDRLTKDGAFEINARGELVNQQGRPVLGEGGPIRFSPGETGARIAEDGTVSTDQGQRGKLRLVTVQDPTALESAGGNLFRSPQPTRPAGITAKLEPGSLERSNVRPILEMSRLVEVQRAYTSIVGLMARTDELRRSAIQRLAEIPV